MFTKNREKIVVSYFTYPFIQKTSLEHLMYVVIAAMGLVLIALVSGCDTDKHASQHTHQVTGDVTAGLMKSDRTGLRPAHVDETVPSIGVESLLRNQQAHSGRLAVEGVVVQCFEERGAFVVVDLDEFNSCGLDACTDAAMPIRIERDEFEGVLPVPGELITLIGDFESVDRGFQFELHEVHLGEAVILARKTEYGA